MPFDHVKFKGLVHYIAWRAGKNDWFGATKLNKVLWFADTRHYVLYGRPITGATYIREKYGPVPKSVMLVREELVREGLVRIRREGTLDRITASCSPDMSIFLQSERDCVDWWIKHIDEEHTASSISEESHDYAWEIARMGEELPYFSVLARRVREPAGDELAWAKTEAARLRKN